MKKTKLKFFFIVFLVTVIISTFCMNGFIASAKDENHGICGENVRWYFEEDTQTLNISGHGRMNDYVASPWRDMQITTVNIGKGITSIGENAFADCKTIQNVLISEGVTEILSGAFAGCRGLKNISVPDSLEFLGGGVFDDCVMLNYTKYGNCCYVGNTSNKYLVLVSAENKAVQSVTINNSAKIIGDSAFSNCQNLASVDIPEGVKRINDGAFSDCYNLRTVNVPTTIEYFGSYVFDNCISLEGTSYLKGITYLKSKSGDYTVAYKSSPDVTDYKVASTVKVIYDRLFYNRTNATSITFTSSAWYSIGRQAFEGCPFITELNISNNCTRIGYRAFANCENLTALTIHNGINRIENSAFLGCTKLDTVTFGNKIKRIDDYAFSNLDSLTDVNFVGTESEYKCIDIHNGNGDLEDKIVYNKSYDCAHIHTAVGNDEEATCCSAGHKGNTYCTDCGQIVKYGDEIEMKEHASFEWKTLENATNTNDGSAERYCADCGMYEYKLLPKTQKGLIGITSAKGIKNERVTVYVNLEENPGFISMALTLNYDRSVLELVSAEDGGILGIANHQPDLSADTFKLSWENDTLSSDISATGTIATLVFKIKDSAATGTKTGISLSYNYNNADIVSANLLNREFIINSGTVDVIGNIIGDADGDGSFTQTDRIYLSRYLADWNGYDKLINLSNADVNGDGSVTTADRIIMSRKLAGWPNINFVAAD